MVPSRQWIRSLDLRMRWTGGNFDRFRSRTNLGCLIVFWICSIIFIPSLLQSKQEHLPFYTFGLLFDGTLSRFIADSQSDVALSRRLEGCAEEAQRMVMNCDVVEYIVNRFLNVQSVMAVFGYRRMCADVSRYCLELGLLYVEDRKLRSEAIYDSADRPSAVRFHRKLMGHCPKRRKFDGTIWPTRVLSMGHFGTCIGLCPMSDASIHHCHYYNY